MPGREGVAEVEDGEDEADEFAQRHHQRDGEGGALRGEDEDAPNADVLSDDIHEEVEPHDWHGQPNHWDLEWLRLAEENCMVVDVWGQEDKAREW